MKNNLFSCLLFFLAVIFITIRVDAQNFRFMEYSAKDGLCDNFIYNIIQDDKGYLWLGTGEGICRFDGIDFVSDFPGDSLPSVPVRAAFKDSQQRLWFGFDNGDIFYQENGRFTAIPQGENRVNVITGFAETKSGFIIVGTQNQGLLSIDNELKTLYITSGLEGLLITQIKLMSDTDLLIGTFDGLFLYSLNLEASRVELKGRFEDIPYTTVQNIISTDDKNSYVTTSDQGIFKISTEDFSGKSPFTIQKCGEAFGLGEANVHSLFEDSDKNLWIGSWGNGLLRLNYSTPEDRFVSALNFDESNGLSGRYFQTIFKDHEGNIWFGTYGEGLFALKQKAFTFYKSASESFDNDVRSIEQIGDLYLLGGEGNILISRLDGKDERVLSVQQGLPDDVISSIYADEQGNVFAGTMENGIYRLNESLTRATPFFHSENSLENMINRITGKGDELWVASNGGVLYFNTSSGRSRIYTTRDKLPHNKIEDILIDDGGEVWIAAPGNSIYSLTRSESMKIDAPAEFRFVAITQDNRNKLWAATDGDGVFGFAPDSLHFYSNLDGLKNNFCYSIAADIQGKIWIGHRLGMSCLNPKRSNISVFSVDQGITADCNPRAILNNEEGKLLFGTNEGLIIYDPFADKTDSLPPSLTITALTIDDQAYDFSQPVVLPYKRYKIRIDFRGINLKNPESVSYRYKLDGYDDWSEPVNTPYVIYSRVEDGNYTFKLQACDENGVCSQYPLELHIRVKIPVWKAWWFYVILILFLFLIVYLYVAYREKKQKQIQEYLQTELDARTKEVRAQSREIEEKNRDITDSINYAQRIQASILPPVKKLTKYFAGSFVFYQPRDIVSGDFYWFDKVWDDKYIIVCADSTGHGVPGAFMSMIGTTLIKDICSRPEINSPSRILATLDEEVQAALNQNIESEKSNDGMDIVVAEIDLNSLKMRISSAMRPVILYLNGEQTYVKGSRSSVGGRFDEEVEDKSFVEEEYQLHKGDLIYMFSDGYPDQFGGPLGKKFKMVRLKNLLHDIHTKPMEEQFNYVKSNFMLWKEELEQVDDVLFMGIRV